MATREWRCLRIACLDGGHVVKGTAGFGHEAVTVKEVAGVTGVMTNGRGGGEFTEVEPGLALSNR
ncbi:hypothetical protein Pen01_61450 [Phytomonospora endophytica]|nr:hypothetical protein Pen01_61450 [Phytomonospora endophytica]